MVMMEYSMLMSEVNRRLRYVTYDILEDIKEHFLEEIDSNRTFDRIDSIPSLIEVLERRDCLSAEDVGPLRYILRKLSGTVDRNEVCNGVLFNSLHISNPTHRVLPIIPNDPVDQVFHVVSSEIGAKWRDLARNLNVSEGAIDELEQQRSGIREKVLQILRYHKESVDEKYWKYRLLNALKDSRRGDLVEQVYDVLARHGL